MIRRREFLKSSLAGAAGLAWVGPGTAQAEPSEAPGPSGVALLDYDLQRHVAAKLFDGKRSFVHARAGAIPGAGKDGLPAVVMTLNTN